MSDPNASGLLRGARHHEGQQASRRLGVFKKVSQTPEWKAYTTDMGLKDAYLAGPEIREVA